uniref:Uncharacterized protein n=1 Tax=Arundo donax TaxID=35708 RepID=A0A0A9HFL0_ARUDO
MNSMEAAGWKIYQTGLSSVDLCNTV